MIIIFSAPVILLVSSYTSSGSAANDKQKNRESTWSGRPADGPLQEVTMAEKITDVSGRLKAEVIKEVLMDTAVANNIAQRCDMHPEQVKAWINQLIEHLEAIEGAEQDLKTPAGGQSMPLLSTREIRYLLSGREFPPRKPPLRA